MSENDNKSPLDDNKNEKDPYDFFKFVISINAIV